MGHLNTLALTALKARAALTVHEQRRAKLLAKLDEQIALAEAEIAGRAHVVMKRAWTRDNDGNKTPVQREKRIRAWWWKDADGLVLTIRYGSRVMELAKGKRALRVDGITTLPSTLRTVMEAVKAGELDDAMAAVVAASKTKSGRG